MDIEYHSPRNLQEAINIKIKAIEAERQGSQVDIQKRVPGQVEIPGVNIIPERIGHDARKRTIEHIKEMEAKGYLPEEEAGKRIEHAADARSQRELNYLTNDLPNMIYKPGYWKDWDWDKPKYFLPVLVTGMFVSLCAAIIPGIVLAQLHEFRTGVGEGIFLPLIILGVLGFWTSMVLTVVKCSK